MRWRWLLRLLPHFDESSWMGPMSSLKISSLLLLPLRYPLTLCEFGASILWGGEERWGCLHSALLLVVCAWDLEAKAPILGLSALPLLSFMFMLFLLLWWCVCGCLSWLFPQPWTMGRRGFDSCLYWACVEARSTMLICLDSSLMLVENVPKMGWSQALLFPFLKWACASLPFYLWVIF